MTFRTLFFALILLLNVQGSVAFAQAVKQLTPAPVQAVAEASEIQKLRQERDQAYQISAIAEAKTEIMKAANSRLEIIITFIGILITVVIVGFSIATYRVAASEATKVARKELSDAREEINEIRKSIKILEAEATAKTEVISQKHDEAIEISDELKSLISDNVLKNSDTKLSPELQKELDTAANDVAAKPMEKRTVFELKILLSQAWQAKDYKKMMQLSEELIDKARNDDDRVSAYNDWGIALRNLGQYEDAIKKYVAALTIKPDHYQSLNNWANALIHLSYKKRGKNREALLAKGEEKCLEAEKIKDGSGSYNLACINALRKDAHTSVKWLRHGKKHRSDFPICDHIAKDKDFNPIRKSKEFQQALKDIGC